MKVEALVTFLPDLEKFGLGQRLVHFWYYVHHIKIIMKNNAFFYDKRAY